MKDSIPETEIHHVHEIVIQEHLEPVIGSKGKFRFRKIEEAPTMDKNGVSDSSLLDLFDKKLNSLKGSMKNLIKDFSTWQTSIADRKRDMRDLESRVTELEN